ncbi:hypothetical protein J2W49_000822 [Hydrogenophaga palleronii]|uniref:Uncharacterized protein n=1 Tax=Hydrogenophaga palleronii TaxID=65655 RepID=A0ABU1WHZ1_9BURK|nr:hypothetical protein [Hydrogenophaga palleronii]MDR7148894.1 hypothetical protein [Hydrogenophaga palleronii]
MSELVEHPPVPQLLQEKLKDYPEILADLQDALNGVSRSPGMSKTRLTDEFEKAIWSLEDGLSHFMAEAASELRAAEASGDSALVAKAEAKWKLMANCRRSVPRCLDELGAFFGR